MPDLRGTTSARPGREAAPLAGPAEHGRCTGNGAQALAGPLPADRYDLLLSATLAKPPVPLGPQHMNNPDLEASHEALYSFTPFTSILNMSGQPSMSVPLHWTPEGLPVGVMVSAPFGDEATLLSLAGQLERARPWFDRLPAIARDG